MGCPHRASTRSDMEDSLFSLLSVSKEIQSAVVERIRKLANVVMKTNIEFEHSALPIGITLWSVYSAVGGLESQVSTVFANFKLHSIPLFAAYPGLTEIQVLNKYNSTTDLPFEIQVGIMQPLGDLGMDPGDNGDPLKAIAKNLGTSPYR